MIVIDKIVTYESPGSQTTHTTSVDITSQDVVLVVFVANSTQSQSKVTFNGTTISQLATVTGNQTTGVYYLVNPQVGTYDIVATLGNVDNAAMLVVTLLGVDKAQLSPPTYQLSFSVATSNLPVVWASANSIALDILNSNQADNGAPSAEQSQIWRSTSNGYSGSYEYAYGTKNMTWPSLSGAAAGVHMAVVLEPAKAPSFWNSNIGIRNIKDVNSVNGIDNGNVPINSVFGYHPAVFFQNSFVHTIGRMLAPPAAVVNPAGEIERPTSQIVIDKVFQGQVGGGTALSMQVSIPSPDAVLVVTGGSVIATGGAWQSVSFNGNPLTLLVAASTVNADAEIWWLPNPTVGTYTLTITPTAVTGQVYANAMVILGVDRRSTNIITASATDAASTATISANIFPDAPNCLIVDALSSLDATAAPVPDNTQNQVLNAPSINASEYLFSTYKIGGASQQNMNYNLSAAVNASLVVAAFRPANAASMWFPNIDNRSLSDVVDANGLDAGTNAASGAYGYKPSNFYLNSFAHTVGRLGAANPTVATSTETMLLMGVGA